MKLPVLALATLLAAVLGGCSMVADQVAADLGLPKRGFVTDAMYDTPQVAAVPRPAACTGSLCYAEASRACVAGGNRPGSLEYNRCLLTAVDNFRRVR